MRRSESPSIASPAGAFWDGKREMVSAPLPNIREECLLWQVDADELWTADQIVSIQRALSRGSRTYRGVLLVRLLPRSRGGRRDPIQLRGESGGRVAAYVAVPTGRPMGGA